jgi:hypothetical protein
VKRSLLVEADGGPLSVVIAGANVADFKLLEATLDAIVVERPEPTEEAPQHLWLDKGYDKQPAREVVERHDYQSTLPQSRVFRAARGAKRHAGRPSALPLQRVWRLLRPDPRHADVPAAHVSRGGGPRAFGGYAPGQP